MAPGVCVWGKRDKRDGREMSKMGEEVDMVEGDRKPEKIDTDDKCL